MNKELMMKAAIQFKGVWPSEKSTHIWLMKSGSMVVGNIDEDMIFDEDNILCTREQFESFVESLFKGAPEGSTHFRPNALSSWYKISNAENKHYLGKEDGWVNSVSIEKRSVSINDLIPRPAKAEPQSAYMPQVGEGCEFKNDRQDMPFDYRWIEAFFVGLSKDGHKIMEIDASTGLVWLDEYDGDVFIFRPLRTEEEIKRECLSDSIGAIFEQHEADVSKACMADLLDLLSE